MLKKPETPTNIKLYDQDFFGWTVEMSAALKQKQVERLDWDNLAEEIESLGRSEKRELRSRLQVLLMHLLKWQFQPQKRSHSWQSTITEQRVQIDELLNDSPSLRPLLESIFEVCYQKARVMASSETQLSTATFPAHYPYSLAETLAYDFWPGVSS